MNLLKIAFVVVVMMSSNAIANHPIKIATTAAVAVATGYGVGKHMYNHYKKLPAHVYRNQLYAESMAHKVNVVTDGASLAVNGVLMTTKETEQEKERRKNNMIRNAFDAAGNALDAYNKAMLASGPEDALIANKNARAVSEGVSFGLFAGMLGGACTAWLLNIAK